MIHVSLRGTIYKYRSAHSVFAGFAYVPINENRFVESIATRSEVPMKITVIHLHTHTRTFYIQHIQLTDSLREINEREKGSDQQHTYNPKRKTTFSQGHLFDKEQCLGAYPVPVRVSIPFRSTLLTLLLFLLEWREWDKERKWIANSHRFWCVSMTCLSIARSSILIQTELVFFFLQSFHFQWTAICTQFECERLARLGRSLRIHHTCWLWSFVLFYWIISF